MYVAQEMPCRVFGKTPMPKQPEGPDEAWPPNPLHNPQQ